MSKIINARLVKAIAKECGRRVGKGFIDALEAHVEHKVRAACEVHNGGKRTLDASVAIYVGIRGRG